MKAEDKLKMVRSQAQKDRAKEIRKPDKPKSQQQKERAKEIRKPHTPRSEAQKDRQKEIRKSGLKKTKKMEKELTEAYEQENSVQQLNELLQGRPIPQRS